MKKHLTLLLATVLMISAVSSASAFWGNNWGGYGWNPYDPWDPRFWLEEFFGGGYYGGGPWGYGGPWGGYGYPYYGGYGYTPWGGYGYAPWAGYGYPAHGGWGYPLYASVPVQLTSTSD
jgi:hypothetical protein